MGCCNGNMNAPSFPLLAAALQRHAELIQKFRAQVEALDDEDKADEFDVDFGMVTHDLETDEAIVALEARIGMPVPTELRTLYQSVGSFEVMSDMRMGHMDVRRIKDLLGWVGEGDIDADWPSLMGALCTLGSREEFGSLEPEAQAVLAQDYVVFGWAHHRHEDRILLVFDRNGGFHSVPYEHDVGEEDWINRYQPFIRQTAQAVTLDEMLAAHLDATIETTQEAFEEDEYWS